ncbi:hypothetical protein AVEN_178860-1 [Araneus ventricosus]|uniref:Uncharacterized protein n=1 Tax=Araneus ventricosus TaxID=182803 RepID=A0A4Y2BEP2_ARAVE|nr:hypothetical protein AVEN_178860-1 [Araneus ventricosus]
MRTLSLFLCNETVPSGELAGLIRESSCFEECDQENIQDWLECDVDDSGYQALVDDEISSSVIDEQDPCDGEEEPSDNDSAEKVPSSEEDLRRL